MSAPVFHKAKLLQFECGFWWPFWFTYFRMANAASIHFLWFCVTWRMPWLPIAAYQEGWNACFRQMYGENHKPK